MAMHKTDNLIPIPGPSALPVFGNLFDLDLDAGLQSVLDLADTYGSIYQLRIAGKTQIFISSRDLLDELCDETRFSKIVTGGVEQLRDGVKDALFTAHDGEQNWGIAHRIIMPIFGTVKVRDMFDQMKDVAEELCLKWARYGSSYPFEVANDFTRLTLDTIALCSMGYRFNSFYREDTLDPFVNSMTGFMKEADKRSACPSFVNDLRRTATKNYMSDIAAMKEISQRIVSERREHSVDTSDLLNALLQGRDPKTGQGLADEAITNNLITFLIAGHETTSGLLSFTLYYLLKYPDGYRKAQEEVDAVIGRDNITVDHLSKLPYITAALRESLRLMPTAPAFSVSAREDCVIGGKYAVKKGEPMTLLLHKIHRDQSVWGEDAEVWKPERMVDENFNKLKKNSWKPFGNGARACIGRAFAWQEAQLVIALLLQTFNMSFDDAAYKLQIKESLTIKPDGFKIRASLRHHENSAELSRYLYTPLSSAAGSVISRDQSSFTSIEGQNSTQGQLGKPMMILFGSNSGTCEALAHRLASHATTYGFDKTIVGTMDSATGALPINQPVVIITASYDGEPADNAGHLLSWLQAIEGSPLEKVTFAVFGCGHRDWHATFHKIPILVDRLLEKAGARRITSLGTADAGISDIFSDFETWEEKALWPSVSANFNPKHIIEPSISEFQISISHPRPTTLHQNVAEGIVSHAAVLTKGGPLKKHIEIQLPSRMTYESGDYLSVLPLNPWRNVQRALAVFRLAKDSVLEIQSSSKSTSLPLTTPISAADLLGSYVELTQPATAGNIRTLAAATSEDTTKNQLLELAGPLFPSEIRDKRASVLDILEKFGPLNLSLGAFLKMLPPLRVRTYSISSSPLWNPSHASLTYSVVDQPSRFGTSQFVGVASNYLAELCEGDVIRVMVRASKPTFHPPKDPGEFPIIMIAAGSGLAPFLGFLQERTLQLRAGLQLKPAVLFFGCRSPNLDDIHRAQLDEFEAAGVVSTRRAYSSSTFADRSYVQDKLWGHKSEVTDLWAQGGKVFVCGSSNMVDGVKQVFGRILAGEAMNHFSGDNQDQFDPSRFVVEVFA